MPGGLISAAWEAGRAEWPELELPVEKFSELTERHLADEAPVHPGDLYLAAACAAANEAAMVAFDRQYLRMVPYFVRGIDPSPAFADEVTQALRERLLVATANAPPKIADYSGRGPLATWLRVSSVRTALNLIRKRRAEPSIEVPIAFDPTPEAEYAKAHYRIDFQEALSAAVAGLAKDHRELLHLLLAEKLPTAKIGERLGVNQSTVVRRVAAVREEIFDETWRRLRDRLGLSPSEFASVAALVLSDLQISLALVVNRETARS